MKTVILFAANVDHQVTDEAIEELFKAYDSSASLNIVKDRITGLRRGYIFVTLEEQAGMRAIESLNATKFGSRRIHVRLSEPRKYQGAV